MRSINENIVMKAKAEQLRLLLPGTWCDKSCGLNLTLPHLQDHGNIEIWFVSLGKNIYHRPLDPNIDSLNLPNENLF